MVDYRQVWMDGSGDAIPKGWHVHHLIPRSEGGPDEYWNLICVSPEMHYDIHFVRGDYGACALISDGIDREAPTKAVVQFDLDGHRVNKFESLSEAGNWMRKNTSLAPSQFPGPIVSCCKYQKKTIGGYQFFYESEVGDVDYVGPPNKKNNSGGHDSTPKSYKSIETGEIFPSQRKAAESLGVKNGGGNWKNKCKHLFIEL